MATEAPSTTNTDSVPVEDTPTATEAGSDAEKSTYGVSFAATRTSGAPPEASGATATAVKPYAPVTSAESSAVKMSSVLESDRRGLLDDDSLSSEDSDYEMPSAGSNLYVSSKWWFQQPAVKKNLCLVIGIWLLIVLGIVLIITGILLESLSHLHSDEVIRGIVFFIIAIIVLIPSVYAATHVYLAARRVGRVRFSSVWFFR